MSIPFPWSLQQQLTILPAQTSLSVTWVQFLGFGHLMLDPAGVCWQEPVPTLHFLCGDISTPCAQTPQSSFGAFPRACSGKCQLPTGLGKMGWSHSSFREQGTNSGGNFACAAIPSRPPARCPNPLRARSCWESVPGTAVSPRSPCPGASPPSNTSDLCQKSDMSKSRSEGGSVPRRGKGSRGPLRALGRALLSGTINRSRVTQIFRTCKSHS